MTEHQIRQRHLDTMKRCLLEQVADMFEANREKFMEPVEEGEAPMVALTFNVRMSFPGKKAALETRLGYNHPRKDSRAAEFDDPDQGTLPFGVDDARAAQGTVIIKAGGTETTVTDAKFRQLAEDVRRLHADEPPRVRTATEETGEEPAKPARRRKKAPASDTPAVDA